MTIQKNTFQEDFSLKDAIKLNKQDPIVQNVIVPVLPENPILPGNPVQNNRNIKEKEKEKIVCGGANPKKKFF